MKFGSVTLPLPTPHTPQLEHVASRLEVAGDVILDALTHGGGRIEDVDRFVDQELARATEGPDGASCQDQLPDLIAIAKRQISDAYDQRDEAPEAAGSLEAVQRENPEAGFERAIDAYDAGLLADVFTQLPTSVHPRLFDEVLACRGDVATALGCLAAGKGAVDVTLPLALFQKAAQRHQTLKGLDTEAVAILLGHVPRNEKPFALPFLNRLAERAV